MTEGGDRKSGRLSMPPKKTRYLTKNVEQLIKTALKECASRTDYEKLKKMDAIQNIAPRVLDDLLSFSKRDPASRSDPLTILKTYTSFSETLHYRIANWIYTKRHKFPSLISDEHLEAKVSRRGKLLSGAEIHFRSRIGDRFILDHGFGTVIGETSIIGDDCYILGGVTLGARGISGNPDTARHPELGNRVEIGAFTAILGKIRIGDDVFIGPNCIITRSIPDGSSVKLTSNLNITLKKPKKQTS